MSAVTPTNGRASTGPRAASRAALDVLLTDAAIEPRTVGRLVQPVTAAPTSSPSASSGTPITAASWIAGCS